MRQASPRDTDRKNGRAACEKNRRLDLPQTGWSCLTPASPTARIGNFG
jgi:hypothetical protein